MDSSSGVILVTGGSQGIGAATCLLAAQQGFAVGVNYRANAQAALNVVGTIRAQGGQAVAVQADVSSEADVEHLFNTVEDKLGPVTALVNNAGVLETQASITEISAARLRRVLDTNVVGTFLCAAEAVRRCAARNAAPGLGIVNVSSRAAVLGSPHEYVDYALSKGAVDTFTVGLAREVASLGIRVNGVRPGIIDTDIHTLGGETGRVSRLGPTLPLGRAGTPEEVAACVLWLLSDAASYVTGSILDVAGGR